MQNVTREADREREREGEREGEREADRERERQTDRQTESGGWGWMDHCRTLLIKSARKHIPAIRRLYINEATSVGNTFACTYTRLDGGGQGESGLVCWWTDSLPPSPPSLSLSLSLTHTRRGESEVFGATHGPTCVLSACLVLIPPGLKGVTATSLCVDGRWLWGGGELEVAKAATRCVLKGVEGEGAGEGGGSCR